MSRGSGLRLSAVLVLGIILPTLVLVYFGMQAVGDEQDRVSQIQRYLSTVMRRQFDSAIQRSVDHVRSGAEEALVGGRGLGGLQVAFADQAFVVGQDGALAIPRVIEDGRPAVSPGFKARIAEAERFEFAAEDYGRALSVYRSIVERSDDPAEQAVALNAEARCARRLGDAEGALQTYKAITSRYPIAFDENGAHLATYAHFQMADLLASEGRWEDALRVLVDWLDAVDRGRYPVLEGLAHYLNIAEQTAESGRIAASDGRATPAVKVLGDDLRQRVRRARTGAGFVQTVRPLLSAPGLDRRLAQAKAGADSVVYLAGHVSSGPYLIAIAPLGGGRFVGMSVDLPVLQRDVLQSAIDESPTGSGFRVSVLDNVTAAEFAREHATGMAAVSDLSLRFPGLKIDSVVETPFPASRQNQSGSDPM